MKITLTKQEAITLINKLSVLYEESEIEIVDDIEPEKPILQNEFESNVDYTSLNLIYKNIVLPKLKGALISEAKDIFKSYIDSDFENWNLNSKTSSKETKINVHEITKDGTLKEIFGRFNCDLDKLVMTQGQIIEFCKNHKEELGQNWYNFFLIKENDEYFVADVHVHSDGLKAVVVRFVNGDVWSAEFRLRVFVPQLDI